MTKEEQKLITEAREMISTASMWIARARILIDTHFASEDIPEEEN